MYLVSVDFSENNLLAEQLNVRSLYDLQVMNYTLFNLQLMRFADLRVEDIYVLGEPEKTDDLLFRINCADACVFLKEMFELDSRKSVLLFRNDVYFENDFSQFENIVGDDEILAFGDEQGRCYAIITTVGRLIKLNNKNVEIKSLIEEGDKLADVYITPEGYKNILVSIKDYKLLLHDILNKKTNFRPPYIAEGVFTNNSISKGDFSIIPPVYLGDTVQIESGSTIGPDTVIYNRVLISENTVIKNSIMFDDVYISSGCFLEGVICCENSSVKRNSAVFSGSLVGENALVGEDMLVENDSVIQAGVRYDNYVKTPTAHNQYDCDYNNFTGLSPEKAVLLGSSLSAVFKRPKILIAGDGTPISMIIKLALLSGLMASGAECIDLGVAIKSAMFFSCSFCECSYCIYVKSKSGESNIEIFNSDGNEIRKADSINILTVFNKKAFVCKNQENLKSIRQIHGLRQLYFREIASVFTGKLRFNVTVICSCKILKKAFDEIFNRIPSEEFSDEKYYININDAGDKITIKFNDKAYNEKILIKLVHFYLKNSGNKNATQNIYYEKFWDKDLVFLLMYVLLIIDSSQKNIEELISDLPDFFILSRDFEKKIKSGELAKRMTSFDGVVYKKGNFNVPCEKGRIRLTCNDGTKKLKVLCASDSIDASNELCNFFGKLIT